MRRSGSYALALATMVLVSCGRTVLRPHGTSPGATPIGPRTGPIVTDAPLPNDLGGDRSGERTLGRTVCKSSGVPRGFVAVDYIQSRECLKPNDSTRVFNAAVLVDLSKRPVGTVLLVCADQTIPWGWVQTTAEPRETGQCPRDPSDKSTGPRVREIERTSAGEPEHGAREPFEQESSR
jgi:hypothetical protein